MYPYAINKTDQNLTEIVLYQGFNKFISLPVSPPHTTCHTGRAPHDNAVTSRGIVNKNKNFYGEQLRHDEMTERILG